MCYSAMVLQSAKKARLQFHARIQTEEYFNLFIRRMKGEKLYLNSAMERQFLDPKTPDEKKIKDAIEAWHESEIERIDADLIKQQERLKNAKTALKTKPTKKASEDQRISTDKIEKLSEVLKFHQTRESKGGNDFGRIFPGHYFTMIALDKNGGKTVMPARYLMRPNDKDASFDREFNGCYNARFDNLKRVKWWADSLEKRRGIMIVSKFFENVAAKDYRKKFKLSAVDKEQEKLVISFEPQSKVEMIIPVLWDCWQKKGESTLYSGALITDDPPPEISAAGHDRCPIFLKESAVDAWLNARSADEAKEILQERERPTYQHEIVRAA